MKRTTTFLIGSVATYFLKDTLNGLFKSAAVSVLKAKAKLDAAVESAKEDLQDAEAEIDARKPVRKTTTTTVS